MLYIYNNKLYAKMKSSELIDLITSDGWKLDRIKGSHHIFIHQSKSGIVVIPHPKKEVPKGTANNILKQAGLRH